MTAEKIPDLAQYLTFTLDKGLYAVSVVRVLNVLEMLPVTKVPRVPDFICGVINLRGNVIPVIDLRVKFGLSVSEETVDTSIIILQLEYEGTVLEVGAIADSVEEVMDLEAKDIEPPPSMGSRLNTAYILGMGKIQDQFVIIIDIDKIISGKDLDYRTSFKKITL